MFFQPPQYVQLYPTIRCNQKCFFCFNRSFVPEAGNPPSPFFSEGGRRTEQHEGARDLSFDRALLLLDILARNGIREIDIMGGEPFLLPWMPDFLQTALSYAFRVNISTNGSLPETMHRISGKEKNTFNIGVSLEGSTEDRHRAMTNSSHFGRAIRSIQELAALDLDPIVKTVIAKRSLDDIQEIVNLIREMGVRRYYLLHMDVFSKDETLHYEAVDYLTFIAVYEEIRSANTDISVNPVHASCFKRALLPRGVRCAGGVRKLAVLPDGSVFPCNLFMHRKDFVLGNLFSDDFSAIWLNPKLDLFRRFEANRCSVSDCRNRSACSGGCPAHGLYHFGDADYPDIRCVLSGNESKKD